VFIVVHQSSNWLCLNAHVLSEIEIAIYRRRSDMRNGPIDSLGRGCFKFDGTVPLNDHTHVYFSIS
jgi:hypothetical protein